MPRLHEYLLMKFVYPWQKNYSDFNDFTGFINAAFTL